MPYTINGIGTHYYGKKNLEKNLGICEKCGREAELTTYETRLWVVFVFIPIIPLGKKQIFDFCPSCTNHRVTSVKEWVRIKEESIKSAMEDMKKNPNDPNAAIRMHLTLRGTGKREEADKLAKMMLAKHASDVEVQLHLGACYAQDGQLAEANACFDQALQVDPGNEQARQNVGIRMIEEGDLLKAHKLIYPKGV